MICFTRWYPEGFSITNVSPRMFRRLEIIYTWPPAGFLLTYRRSVQMKLNFAVLAVVAALSTAPLMASAADAGSTGSSAPSADAGTPKKTTKHHHHKKSSKGTTAAPAAGSK